MPSSIAPIQVVIVPIIFKEHEEKIMEECKKVKEEIEALGISCVLDDRDKTPGSKFYDWEIKGVPLRVEIGPKDIEKNVITLVARDGIKKQIDRAEIEKIGEELKEYDKRLYDNAKKFLEENIFIIKKLERKDGILEAPWCGDEKCGKEMEEKLEMKSLGIPLEERECNENCIICGRKGSKWLRLAKSY